jgi:hypothetical protein
MSPPTRPSPTICPLLLMPRAAVKTHPGLSLMKMVRSCGFGQYDVVCGVLGPVVM